MGFWRKLICWAATSVGRIFGCSWAAESPRFKLEVDRLLHDVSPDGATLAKNSNLTTFGVR